MKHFWVPCLLMEQQTSSGAKTSAGTVYPKKYAHGFCFAVLCCGYTLTDFPISIRLTSLALWQSNDCPSASKATLMNMDKYLMWIHYERLHNHNKAKHNKTVCIFLGIYCTATTKSDPLLTHVQQLNGKSWQSLPYNVYMTAIPNIFRYFIPGMLIQLTDYLVLITTNSAVFQQFTCSHIQCL